MSRKKKEKDLERELQSHLDLEAEESQDSYAAQRALGNIARLKEDVRAVWGSTSLDCLARDLRYAIRTMRRRPAFTAVAVLSLAIALGANTAVFSFVNAIVLRQLPVPGAERLVIVRQNNEMFHIENCCFSYPFFRELRKQDQDFEGALAMTSKDITLTDREQTERLQAEIVSGNYFSMLGVHAAAGRLLDENDDLAEGTSPVCVISYRLWQERFGGQSDVVGRQVLLNAEPFQIVGVSERGFSGGALHAPHDLQIPASMIKTFLGEGRDTFGWAQIVARLKHRVTATEAQTHLNVLGRNIEKITGPRIAARDDFFLRDGTQGINAKKDQFGKPVLVLLLLVGAVLLAACANLAALLLVRSVERTREAGLRLAIGAPRSALLRQFLTESLLLAMAGGVAGWILAQGLIRVLLSLLGQQGEGLAAYVRPGVTLFAFSIATTCAAGLLFGFFPAWRAAHSDPILSIHGVASANPAKRSWTSGLAIAGQIALSLALLFCAGLFARTLRNLRAVDLGFRPENVIMLHVDLSQTAYKNEGAGPFFEELLRRTLELPDVRAASLTNLFVLSGSMASVAIQVPGNVRPVTNFTKVSAGYFSTLGIPLLAGRDIGPDENEVIVNQEFARQFMGGDALDKVFSYGSGRTVRIVGIAGTARYRSIREEPQPIMYLPAAKGGYPRSLYLQVRASGDSTGMIAMLRTLLQNLDARVPPPEVTTMEIQLDQALARERLLAFLSTLLGSVALTLSAIGLYGVLSFSVTRRTREIGIRLSVGARRQTILGLFLRESAWFIVTGFVAGIPLALLCGRLASSLLYGLPPQDTSTAAGAAALLASVALAAAVIPVWRASRVDPIQALRHE
jgi:predicted permease